MSVTQTSGNGYGLYNGVKVLLSEIPEGAEYMPLDGMTVIEWDGDTADLATITAYDTPYHRVADYVSIPFRCFSVNRNPGSTQEYSVGSWFRYADNGWEAGQSAAYNPYAIAQDSGIYFARTSGGSFYTTLLAYEPMPEYESHYSVASAELVATADAIRAKTGNAAGIAWEKDTGFASAVESISGSPVLQEKTATENGEVVPDDGYDGLSKVTVDVPASGLTYYDGTADIVGGNTVTFVANGSTWAVFGVPSGRAVYLPSAPAKDGLYFSGWYTEENGGGDKIAFPYVPETSITLYANFSGTTVIGVTGLTNEDGTLTLTDDIAGIGGGYRKAQNGDYVNVTSDLNNIFPFCDIGEFTDDSGNVFVKFPKLWMKWETDDANRITGYKFSNYQADEDFFIPDAFLDPTNTAADTYLDYFALGKYEMSGSTDKGYSVPGATLLTGITRGEGRAAARAYGSSDNLYNGYQMLDLAQLTLYNLMCMMFFGTANIQKVYGGRTGCVAEWSENSVTGTTDGVDGLNGWNVNTDCVKMLGVENPYGNASKWVDGVYFSGTTIYAHRFPQQYADSSENGISLGFNRPTGYGYITALQKGTTDTTRSFVYASAIGGNENQYFGDCAYYSSEADGSGTGLFSGGSYGGREGAGLWYFSASDALLAYDFRGARLAYRPIDIKEG